MMLYLLADKHPIAEGAEKYIFQHPDDHQLLIKVWKKQYYELLLKKYSFIHKLYRAPKYISLTNEVVEHIVLKNTNQGTEYVQDVIGFCDTDLGLGLVVRAVRNEEGGLALTLGDLVDQKKYNNFHKERLDIFIAWLRDTKVIIRDLSSKNVVFCEQTETFVVIDGIGAKALPSLRKIFALYNKRSNNKRADKLLSRVAKGLRK